MCGQRWAAPNRDTQGQLARRCPASLQRGVAYHRGYRCHGGVHDKQHNLMARRENPILTPVPWTLQRHCPWHGHTEEKVRNRLVRLFVQGLLLLSLPFPPRASGHRPLRSGVLAQRRYTTVTARR